MIRKIELLAPAKNLECGLAAFSHGADAVYIGAPKFGARAAVGNSIADIEKLATEAHIFGAKLFVAFNTILYDNELEEAEQLIYNLYNIGIDALIIQDFGILEMNLPPIPLHASTQTNNYTVEKIQFLEKVGFERAVLARELSLEQIALIKSQTTIELEAFVHGSLCVSLSGQCFMSNHIGGRSANRGSCAQPCRKKMSLIDNNGAVISENQHLLSLKDLNRSSSIEEMIEAGVTSFKIEGRLKDVDYVKNITAFYRKKIDAIIEKSTVYNPASDGKTFFSFSPNVEKSFSRGSTNYFLYQRDKDIALGETSKSVGEEIGYVTKVTQNYFEINSTKSLSNNDGLMFISPQGENVGLKVNTVDKSKILPDKMNFVKVGTKIYRNFDHQFRQQLEKKSAARKIAISLLLIETEGGFSLLATDETGVEARVVYRNIEKIAATSLEKSKENIFRQLSKLGDTIFEIDKIEINGVEKYFFQASFLNNFRREVIDNLSNIRKSKPKNSLSIVPNNFPYPVDSFEFENNVSNHLAKRFYNRHGVAEPGVAHEKSEARSNNRLMMTKHCLKFQFGFCKKYGGSLPNSTLEPLWLVEGTQKFKLEFDCKNCLMKIVLP